MHAMCFNSYERLQFPSVFQRVMPASGILPCMPIALSQLVEDIDLQTVLIAEQVACTKQLQAESRLFT